MALRWIRVALLLLVVTGGGCRVEEIVEGEPPTARLKLDTLTLDFGIVPAGTSLTQEVTIRNTGYAELGLEDLFVDGSQSFVLDETGLDRLLDPGEHTVLPVTFAPVTNEEASGTLHVVAGDPDLTAGTVSLDGMGVAPAIELDPEEHTFDDLGVGCEQEVAITITNVGWGALELQDVIFAPTSDEFEFAFYFGPGTYLEPNESESLTVFYTPRDELPDTGYLTVYSDDPARPGVQAIQYGTAQLCPEVEDTFVQEDDEGADILWVMDNAGLMFLESAQIAIFAASFLDVLEVLGVDYHLGVVTTDTPVLQGAVPIMTPATPDIHAAFADALAVGTAGNATEQGLRMASEALYPPYTLSGGLNEGFLRDRAGLHVFVVSDVDDQSPDSVATYVSRLQALEDDPDDVRTHGMLVLPAPRYEQAIGLTGGGIVDLWGSDWMNSLTSLAWTTYDSGNIFELSDHAVEETLEVDIDGTPLPSGWDYDRILNAVVFHPDSVPDPGETITIRYSPLADCDGC